MVQQLQEGLVDFMVSGTAIWGSVAPKLQVFDFPFLWRDWEHVHAVVDGRVGREAADYPHPPFLWLQSDGAPEARYVQVRDRLLGGLRGGGELLVVGGSSHGSFTDSDSYLSPSGRLLLGEGGSGATDAVPTLTGDVIAGFVGPIPGGPGDQDLDHALARHPSIRRERHIASAG